MTKPIFKSQWSRGKTPSLQINVLRLIVTSGQLSKKKVTEILLANYPDVSDSMDALRQKGFIKLSVKRRTSGHNPEKFYRITEMGLRALLEVKLDRDEFWRAIILLCIFSKEPISDEEFNNYFLKYERKGNFSTSGYYFLTPICDKILSKWLQANDNSYLVPIPQKIIEYLAFNGQSDIKELSEGTTTSEEELRKIISDYSVGGYTHFKSPYDYKNIDDRSGVNMDKWKDYSNFVLHLIINARKTKEGLSYELSLFGVMLILTLITYYFIGKQTSSQPQGFGGESGRYRGPKNLFYSDADLKSYFDKIAVNYKNKIPLIFGKWDLLKSRLGVMLYDGFDFLIFLERRSNIIFETIWFSGSREFYDDIQVLTYVAISRLRPMYRSGIEILKGFENRQEWITNDSRLAPIRNKLQEIEEISKYADISATLQELRSGNPFRDLFKDERSYTMSNDHTNYIESILRDELTFLFYLSLNTNILSKSYLQPSVRILAKSGKKVIPYESKEAFELGEPRDRLMSILAEDKDISCWFSSLIAGIIEYRRQTSNRMSEFYDQITKTNEHYKERKVESNSKGKAVLDIMYEEDDVKSICCNTEIDSIYDYSVENSF